MFDLCKIMNNIQIEYRCETCDRFYLKHVDDLATEKNCESCELDYQLLARFNRTPEQLDEMSTSMDGEEIWT